MLITKIFISHIMTPHIHDMNIYYDIATVYIGSTYVLIAGPYAELNVGRFFSRKSGPF